MEIWEPKTRGTLWATLGLLRDEFTFTEVTRKITVIWHMSLCLLADTYERLTGT